MHECPTFRATIASQAPALLLLLAAFLLTVPIEARAGTGRAPPSANALFGAVGQPTAGPESRILGSYARGCLEGAEQLPVEGPGWQVVRLSRNRSWGHPELIDFIERLAAAGRRAGEPSLVIGDMSQPRGGPLRYGHASHQIGLDVDIWLSPPPTPPLSPEQRERLVPVSMLKQGQYSVDPNRFGGFQAALIHRAALFPEVERIFVNPGIKKALCLTAGTDRAWLGKVRPWYGHDEHMHVRLRCPPGQTFCKPQDPPPAGDGCGRDLARWLAQDFYLPPVLDKPARPLALAALPAACRAVLREP
jgi:penicillin-insensitive murein endopeptidase